jgi:hypothetical protein
VLGTVIAFWFYALALSSSLFIAVIIGQGLVRQARSVRRSARRPVQPRSAQPARVVTSEARAA